MEGWTGKDCPNCDGRGTVRDDYGHEVTCDACGGSGHEWGEIPDESDGWSPKAISLGLECHLTQKIGRAGKSTAERVVGIITKLSYYAEPIFLAFAS